MGATGASNEDIDDTKGSSFDVLSINSITYLLSVERDS